MTEKAGLITWDAAGNVLLDTTTAMFRLLGTISIRTAWVANSSDPWNDKNGSHSDPALTLGEPFLFYRPASFRETDPLDPTKITITVSGTTISWTWKIAHVGTTPSYIQVDYGVRS